MTTLLRLARTHMGLLILLAVTLVIRGGLMVARFNQLRDDPDKYLLIAHNMGRFATFSVVDPNDLAGDPTPSAFRPPLYPVILSNLAITDDFIIYEEAIAALHVALGVATVWLTYLIARACGLGWASYLAGLLVACDPILLNQQSLIMTETLAAACTVLAWGLLLRFHFDRNWWNAGLAGGAIGLAALCRPTFLPWLAISAAIVLCLQPGRFASAGAAPKMKSISLRWGQRLLNAAALLVAGLGVMSPWAIRNYQSFREPLLTTTHGGYTLYLANNRHFYRYLREDQSGLPWDPRTRTAWGTSLQYQVSFREERFGLINAATGTGAPRLTNEFEVDRLQSELGRQAIQDDPTGFLLAAWFRVRQLWSPLPFQLEQESTTRTALRYLTAAWYLAVYVLAIVGAYRLRGDLLRSPWLWGVSLCLLFTAVHVFYWCNLRMRAPLMPIVAMVAAAGVFHRSPLAPQEDSSRGAR